MKSYAGNQEIVIIDREGNEKARFLTGNPDWAFEQYTRNRDAHGFKWTASQVPG